VKTAGNGVHKAGMTKRGSLGEERGRLPEAKVRGENKEQI